MTTKLLANADLTQDRLAHLLGVSTRVVRQWTTDPHNMSYRPLPEPIRRLCRLIDIDPDNIIAQLETIAGELPQ